MDLLERYLNAVGPLLPRENRDDILRELSENILSQMEEKAEDLGRPLNDSEQAEVIKKHGHPVTVAARYRPPRYLIGPALFPFYWLVLRIAAAGALLVRLIVAIVIVLVNANSAREAIPALLAVPYVLVPVFCWITGAFAAFEACHSLLHLNVRFSWDPRSLPAIDGRAAAIPRTHSAAEIIFGVAGLFWWEALPAAPYLLLGPAAYVLTLGPVWIELHWPVLLLAAAAIAQSTLNLLRPIVTPSRTRVRLCIQAFGLGLLCLAIRSGNWVVLASGVHEPSQYGSLLHITNQVFVCLLWSGLLIGGSTFAWQCIQHARDSRSGFAGTRTPGHAQVLMLLSLKSSSGKLKRK